MGSAREYSTRCLGRCLVISVLIVDDQRLVRAGLRMLCAAAEDMTVAGEASNGVEAVEIGRASCRERVCPYVEISVVAGSLKKKSTNTNDDDLTSKISRTTKNNKQSQ